MQQIKGRVSARLSVQDSDLLARKAIPSTKIQKPERAPQSVSSSDHRSPDGKRRGRKQLLQADNVHPTGLFSIDAIFADNEAPEPERVDLEKALPAKARRGRKPKASSAPETTEADVSATGMISSDHPKSTVVEDVDLTPEATPVTARRKRKIDGQSSPPEAAVHADPIDDAVEIDASLVSLADVGALTETPSAATWNTATGAISFDWPSIERTAGTEGPNQAMAKLLLAARDEGVNSRWSF